MITEEQRKTRSRGIGGSDAAAIVGISPYSSPVEVWEEKTRARENEGDEGGRDAEVAINLELGNEMESIIARRWARIEGKPLVTGVPTHFHPEHEWMLGNVDGLVGEDEGLEVKLVLSGERAAQLGEEGTDSGLPEHVIQCHHYMAVTNRKRWHLVYFDPRVGLRTYLVKRDEEFEKRLIAAEGKFWQHVKDGTLPSEHMQNASRYALSRMYAIATQGMMEATPEQVLLAEQYAAAHREVKEAEKKKTEAWKGLVQSIGDFSGFEWPGGKVTYRNAKSGPVNWQKLARQLGATPEMIVAAKPPIGSRRLLVKVKSMPNEGEDEAEG